MTSGLQRKTFRDEGEGLTLHFISNRRGKQRGLALPRTVCLACACSSGWVSGDVMSVPAAANVKVFINSFLYLWLVPGRTRVKPGTTRTSDSKIQVRIGLVFFFQQFFYESEPGASSVRGTGQQYSSVPCKQTRASNETPGESGW